MFSILKNCVQQTISITAIIRYVCADTKRWSPFIFTYEDIPNSVRLRKRDGTLVGIDIRSTGGCVIAPPSSYEKGSYKFICVKSPQKCPDFLLSLFT